ncbi:hypothetical protein BJP35_2442 [Enterobacter sp. J49]|uniref:response regulator transcription factor n=1 Tax=Enterobacter sp. J49 TaxID=1903627 RepID=UPI000A3A58AF|nr:response regulator transcription factor [Enterobacter sp. J49]OUC37177.1 hypothetical protein BJP35_2442 [Enterobacter sp. J49]
MLTVTDNCFFGAAFKHKSSSEIIQPEELLKQHKNKQFFMSKNTTILVSIQNHTLLLEIIKLLMESKIKNIYIYISSFNERSFTLADSGIIILSGKIHPQKVMAIINHTQKKQELPVVKLTKITARDWTILVCLFRGLDNKIISTLFNISEKAISGRVNLACSKLKIPFWNRPKKISTLEMFFTIYHIRNNEGKKDEDPNLKMMCAS